MDARPRERRGEPVRELGCGPPRPRIRAPRLGLPHALSQVQERDELLTGERLPKPDTPSPLGGDAAGRKGRRELEQQLERARRGDNQLARPLARHAGKLFRVGTRLGVRPGHLEKGQGFEHLRADGNGGLIGGAAVRRVLGPERARHLRCKGSLVRAEQPAHLARVGNHPQQMNRMGRERPHVRQRHLMRARRQRAFFQQGAECLRRLGGLNQTVRLERIRIGVEQREHRPFGLARRYRGPARRDGQQALGQPAEQARGADVCRERR